MSDYIMDAAKSPQATAPRDENSAAARDLSRSIEQHVVREPHDAVRCVRVFGDFYRCNWWSRLAKERRTPDYDWGGLITDHIRQSRFLKATLRGDELILEDVPTTARPESA